MIYWKQTDVYGFPAFGVLVFVWYRGAIHTARLQEGDGKWMVWFRSWSDQTDGNATVTVTVESGEITDWSEKNAPSTFKRKPVQGEQA